MENNVQKENSSERKTVKAKAKPWQYAVAVLAGIFCYVLINLLLMPLNLKTGWLITSLVVYFLPVLIIKAFKKSNAVKNPVESISEEQTRENSSVGVEMINFLADIRKEYTEKRTVSSSELAPIFDKAFSMILNKSEHALKKSIKEAGETTEGAALNILQNVAMLSFRKKTAVDFILNKDPAYDLYMYINDLKLENGLIDKKQHEANADLGLKLSVEPPIGDRWL